MAANKRATLSLTANEKLFLMLDWLKLMATDLTS